MLASQVSESGKKSCLILSFSPALHGAGDCKHYLLSFYSFISHFPGFSGLWQGTDLGSNLMSEECRSSLGTPTCPKRVGEWGEQIRLTELSQRTLWFKNIQVWINKQKLSEQGLWKDNQGQQNIPDWVGGKLGRGLSKKKGPLSHRQMTRPGIGVREAAEAMPRPILVIAPLGGLSSFLSL